MRPLVYRFVLALGVAFATGCTNRPQIGTSDPELHSHSRAEPIATAAGAAAVSPRLMSVAAAPRPSNPSHDAYVLLSGGGTPLSNNYSQYLQARAIADFFRRECPPERTWVFFGAGNRDGDKPLLADARRELNREGTIVQSWLPGVLARNRPATREAFLRALREEILPLVRDGGTLFLFVGDHGELIGEGAQQESAITMWQLKPRRRRGSGWFTDDKEVLGVTELRQVLREGLGDGQVVFGMTQCHGGGFHELAVRQDMIPPREWFSGPPPAWAVGASGGLHVRAAGFTATDEASLAAGCDADPDPDRWAGYERFLPESLLGIDLMSGRPKQRSVASFAEAHETATLIDQTIDKPRATSEHYLEAWARLIETKLLEAPRLAPDVQTAMENFQRAVDRGRLTASDAAFAARQSQFERFTRQLAEQAPAARDLLLTGTRRELEGAVRGRGERGGGTRGNRRGAMAELRREWSETLRPAWKTAVESGRSGVTGDALEFEKRLLKLEDNGRDFLLPRGGNSDALVNEIYWESTYAEPARFDRAKAEAVARWGAERRAQIIAWGKASSSANIRAAAEKIGPGPTLTLEPPRPLSRKTAAERVLFYRRVLAAWEFLLAVKADAALAELHLLIELEHRPIRPLALQASQ